VKAKERAALLSRVRTFGGIVHVFPSDDVRFIKREIDRAVRKARREERAKHCTCQRETRCAYCENRRKGKSR
jgi:hypothetical protein